MHLDASSILLLAGVAVAAGAVNAIAGGGTLLSFPVLLFLGLPALTANVTNTLGMLPGYTGSSIGYRAELSGQANRVRVLGLLGAAGAVAGALLLTVSSPALFRAIAPWLILVSAALLALQPLVSRLLARSRQHPESRRSLFVAGIAVTQLGAGLYGAYFGAGVGVMLLATLGLWLPEDLQRLNALKSVLSLVINAVAVLIFVFLGPVAWTAVAVMAPGTLLGGLIGAMIARRIDADVLRVVVVLLAVVVAVRLLL